MLSLPILSGLALWWPWPFFIPAKSTYDATFLNKLAWLKSSTYARPHGPSYCVCLLFLILGSPTQHLAFCYHYSCGFRSHVHVCGAFSWYKKPTDIRRPSACWHYIPKISLGITRKITGQTRRIKPMSGQWLLHSLCLSFYLQVPSLSSWHGFPPNRFLSVGFITARKHKLRCILLLRKIMSEQ